MTREEAIQYIDGLHCEEDFPYTDIIADFVKERNEAIDMAIEAIRHDVIFEQIKWERDVALQTLEEHGIGLGQKCDAEVVSADAVQGDWLYRWNEVECSVCGEFAKDKSNFCPNCGARMENTK